MLNVVNLGELAPGVGRDELLKLGHGLATEIGAVHKKEDALRPGVFDEPVGEAARGVGLARAGGHLDEGARMGGGKGFFQVRDAFDLAGAEVLHRERMSFGHLREATAQGIWFGKHRRECFRSMEREDAAGTRSGITFVTEKGFDAGGFVKERQRTGREGLDEVGQILRVMAGLFSDARQECALFLGFGDPDGVTIHEQEIVTRTGFERHFAQGNAAADGGIELPVILHDPPAGGELRVDLLAGELFGSQVRHGMVARFSLRTSRLVAS